MSLEKASRLISDAMASGASELSLSHLRLGDEVPELLGQLGNLKDLRLSVNELAMLPESVRQLAGLVKLDLTGNRLTELPSWLRELTSLTELRLGDNQLTTLPDWIGQLTNLTTLWIGHNQLTSLPESLGQLTDLTSLYLDGNQLTGLPESLGQLTKLAELNLVSNQLSQIPESMGQLVNLTWLSLNENQLATLPDSLGQLVNLTTLSLSKNQLSELPESLAQLVKLTKLNLPKNPLPKLLLKVVAADGPDGLRAWFSQDRSDADIDVAPEIQARLSPRVLDLIELHGGHCSTPNGDLDAVMSSIDFSRGLFGELALDSVTLQAAHEFVTTNAALRASDPEAWEDAVWELVGENDRGVRFDESLQLDPRDFSRDAEDNMRELIEGPTEGPLEFHQFGTGVYPDTFMVYLEDPDPSDPIIYIDDHETLWNETYTATLSGLLESFLTLDQAVAILDANSDRYAKIQDEKAE